MLVRRAQIAVETGRRVEVSVPQEHPLGAEAEVAFGEAWVMLRRVKTNCHRFVELLARFTTSSLPPRSRLRRLAR